MIFLASQLIAQQRTAMIHLAHRRLHAAVGHARCSDRTRHCNAGMRRQTVAEHFADLAQQVGFR